MHWFLPVLHSHIIQLPGRAYQLALLAQPVLVPFKHRLRDCQAGLYCRATSASIPLSRGERFSSLRSCSSFAEHENWQQWLTHLSNSKCSRDAHGAQTTRHSPSRNRRNPHHIRATPTHAHSAALHQQSAGEPHHESADNLAIKPANHPQTQASKASAPPIARMAHTLR